MEITLQKMLIKLFKIGFPISGGFGLSVDDAIVIHKKNPNDYVSVEYGILKCLGVAKGVEWKLLRQKLMMHKDRKIDQFTIETTQKRGGRSVSETEDYFFDITECCRR